MYHIIVELSKRLSTISVAFFRMLLFRLRTARCVESQLLSVRFFFDINSSAFRYRLVLGRKRGRVYFSSFYVCRSANRPVIPVSAAVRGRGGLGGEISPCRSTISVSFFRAAPAHSVVHFRFYIFLTLRSCPCLLRQPACFTYFLYFVVVSFCVVRYFCLSSWCLLASFSLSAQPRMADTGIHVCAACGCQWTSCVVIPARQDASSFFTSKWGMETGGGRGRRASHHDTHRQQVSCSFMMRCYSSAVGIGCPCSTVRSRGRVFQS